MNARKSNNNLFEIKNFNTSHEASVAIVDTIYETLKSAINENNKASLIVPGGTSPKQVFKMLNHKKLDWNKVFITLSDERCLPSESEHSNSNLVRKLLFKNNASKATFFEPDALTKNAPIWAKNIKNTILPTDFTLLGMGSDGHIASLFPDDINNTYKNELVHNSTAPFSPKSRVTLSYSALSTSQKIGIMIFGREKKALFEDSIRKNNLKIPFIKLLNKKHTPTCFYIAVD